MAVAQAVRECVGRLRAAEWGIEGLDALSEKLVALAGHESPRVRQAIAEAAPYLAAPVFADLVSRLGADRSPYVREEAARAERRRSALRRAAVKDEEHDTRVERWYAELNRHKGARKLAERISGHEREYFVRRLHHDAATTYMAFKSGFQKIREAMGEPTVDRARVREEVDQLERLFEFLQHLLDGARKNAAPIEGDFREERLRALVEEQAAVVRAHFADRAGRMEIDLRELDPRLAADVDAKFIKQAVGNILKNAVEAYPAAGDEKIEVRVSARKVASGTQVELAFADRGCGMQAEQVAHAFMPFGSSKPGGTGFGLFLARNIARTVHGGDLVLESVAGKGTTVTMTLPVRQEKGRAAR